MRRDRAALDALGGGARCTARTRLELFDQRLLLARPTTVRESDLLDLSFYQFWRVFNVDRQRLSRRRQERVVALTGTGWPAHARRAPVVVGLGGSVASGKSTFAAALAGDLAPHRVEVVSTDGFLFPNAVLAERDLTLRKGFPESYDEAAITEFLGRVRAGDPEVSAPVYSHEVYDVVAERHAIGTPDVCIVEGVNVLRFAEILDVSVYLHADEEHLIAWYSERFVRECALARTDETSFYRGWSGLPEAEQRELARQFWYAINHPNLVDHIEPTAARADVVVVKAPDHTVSRIEWRG